ncbi:major facilitator superfamily domain-containing protein [Mycena galericulata]|nr:major facilitator superfamily domain-containing protein [Mycena galericulata]
MVGPAFGPVLGGVLADKLGWRAIFWFLCITAAVVMIVLILFLPETLRIIVGNGSIRPSKIYYALIPIIGRHSIQSTAIVDTSSAVAAPRKKFQNPLPLLLQADILLLLVINGVVYAVCYGVTASISSVFHEAYPKLTETDLGLCFLTIGVGTILGSMFSGKILNWDYQNVRRSIPPRVPKQGEVNEKSTKADDTFPIEKARLRITPVFLGVFSACVIGYGWCIEQRTNIAGPLILLFGVGFSLTGYMNASQTLMLDLVPTQGSSVTACNNLVRCGLGAGLVSGMQPLLGALGSGYAYLLLGGIGALMGPATYLVIHIGPRWRARRIRKAEAKKERARAEADAQG